MWQVEIGCQQEMGRCILLAYEGTKWSSADGLYQSETSLRRRRRRLFIIVPEDRTGTVVEVRERRWDSSKKVFRDTKSPKKEVVKTHRKRDQRSDLWLPEVGVGERRSREMENWRKSKDTIFLL